MLGLEMVVVLGVAVVMCGALARRFPVAPAILLVLVGVLVGFVPALRQAGLPPEVVLLLFLPALLYWESLTTSLREIRSNLRVIVLASTALVVATAAAVAVTAHALGMAWGPGWVLGAAVAPTDATAVGVLARALPRRIVTVLRAESLVNDGTALVIYGLAVGVTVGGEHLGVAHVAWLTVLAYGGGVAAGALVALVNWQVRRRMDDPMLENITILVVPFAAFLLADSIHASGVLAVVTCGLLMSRLSVRITSATARQQLTAFWSLATTVLSSVLFVLVGLQAQSAVRNLTSVSAGRAIGYVFAVTGVVIGVRWAWTYTTPYLIRAIDRRAVAAAAPDRGPATDRQRGDRVPRRGVVGGGAGRAQPPALRGAVSRPRSHRRHHQRSHRADPVAGPAAAAGGPVRPAARRHVGRRGAPPGRDHRRRCRRGRDRAGRHRTRLRPARGRAGATRTRQGAQAARRRPGRR